jgi:hypothetical protein
MKTINHKTKSLVQVIDDHVICDLGSWELRELVDNLPEHTEEAASAFCDRFDLGDWFYEAMVINEVDINLELINIGARLEQEEEEAARDRAEIDRDYRMAQGWPY